MRCVFKENKKIILGILLCVVVLLSNITAYAQQPYTNQDDIKYVSFPNEFKKYEVYPWEMLKLSEFSKSYRTILGSRIKEKWIRMLDGPSSPSKMIATSQGNFVVIQSCKQHYCNSHFIIILFNPVTVQSWMLLLEEEKIYWFGNPDDKTKVLLKKVLKVARPDVPANRIN
jgi:hypothetical protein